MSKWKSRSLALALVIVLLAMTPIFFAALWQLLVADNNPILFYVALAICAIIIQGVAEGVWNWFSSLQKSMQALLFLATVLSVLTVLFLF